MILSGGAAGALVPLAGGIPVLSRCHWNTGFWTDGGNATHDISDGTKTWAVGQRRHVVLWPCSGLKLVYAAASAYEASYPGHADNQISAAVTVSATVWKQVGNPNTYSGSPVDVTFGGATSQAMTQDEVLVSDAVPTLTFKKGDIVWTRTLVTVATLGDKWHLAWPMYAVQSECYATGTGTPTDYLHSGNIGSTALPAGAFGPVASLATPA